jgi:hypothetical protein
VKQQMTGDRDWDTQDFQAALSDIQRMVWALAKKCQSDTQALLSLLRTIELLHREIRVQLFEPSLPETRQELYQMLKDIEESGGWPYIERMKLQYLLNHWQSTAAMAEESGDLAAQTPGSCNQEQISRE